MGGELGDGGGGLKVAVDDAKSYSTQMVGFLSLNLSLLMINTCSTGACLLDLSYHPRIRSG